MFKKISVLALFFLMLNIFAQAQTIVKNVELPNDYEKWPHKFEKGEKIQGHSLTINVWGNLFSPSPEKLEVLQVFKIDGEIIESMNFKVEVSAQGLIEGFEMYRLVKGGYWKLNLDELENLSEERLEEILNEMDNLFIDFILKKFQLTFDEFDIVAEQLYIEAEDFLLSIGFEMPF